MLMCVMILHEFAEYAAVGTLLLVMHSEKEPVEVHFCPRWRLGSANACALVHLHHQACYHAHVRHDYA